MTAPLCDPPLPPGSPLPVQLLVLCKEPLPGRAKTRLTPPLTAAQASLVARAALLDTLETGLATPVAERVAVLDGSPLGWLPAGWAVRPQVAGDLGDRLEAALDEAFGAADLPVLLLGMDTPQVTSGLLVAAVEQLLRPGTDAVLGLADDGGWWALGLRAPAPGVFRGVPMSTDRAGQVQAERLRELGRRTVLLPPLRDVDTVADLAPVAALQPPSARFASAVRGLALPALEEVVA